MRNKLSFKDKDPNKVYRIVNDDPDSERLNIFLEAGYSFVHGKAGVLGDKAVAEGGAIDSRISKPVGGGKRGYLMCIDKELYEQDQALKAEAIKLTEAATKPKAEQSQYGAGLTDT
jgi:hypothetical protein